tara:strand:+ start:659 stop:1336 length:678 start_codon:yes stop_codon:yes gene_type:complete
MKEKKSLILWLPLFIFLTTYSLNSENETKESFLSIKTIKVEGIINLDAQEIRGRLNKFKGKSMILINRNEIRKLANNFQFIKELKVKKIYPDTIKVTITEHEPLGIFFNKNKKNLLIEGGGVIENYKDDKTNTLPAVYGKGAEKKFHIFCQSLKDTNFKIDLIEQFNYFQINRWDIILKDGKVVKLPAEDYDNSLEEFLSIYQKNNFNNFRVFDFRVKGQLILKQ